jgi:tetratricopeptide (TPR) repeat protein
MPGSLLGQTPRDFFDALAGPTTPEQRLAGEKYRTAEFECRRSLESSPRTAITACEEAVVISTQLAPQRLIERSSALAMLGRAFFVNGKPADALLKTEEALEIRSKGSAGRDDEGVATLLENLGIIHFSMNNFPEASESMEASIRSYEGAIEKVPSLKTSYTQRLQATIRRYAEMKKSMGDVTAAESLSRRADSLTAAATPPANPVEEFQVLDGVRLMGLTGARLTEDDLKKYAPSCPTPLLRFG